MKKIISSSILIILLTTISLIYVLSTNGIETKKFNNFISKKINKSNSNISFKLNTIKFKLDIDEISLFLDTTNPEINYRDVIIPTQNIKVYIDFISLIKSNPKITKINLILKELDIIQLKKLSSTIKPSNFKSLINNKIKNGKLISQLEFYLDENNLLKNFIAKGSVSNLKIEILNNLSLENANFDFFADKTDILLKNVFGETNHIKINNGDLKLELSPEISLRSNFTTDVSYNINSKIVYKDLIKNFKYAKDLINLKADLNNSLFINFDKTYKVKDYTFKSNGKISKVNFNFKKPFTNYFIEQQINQLSLENTEVISNFKPKNNSIVISGKYSTNNKYFLPFNLENIINKDKLDLKLDIDYSEDIKLDIINYQKTKNTIANFSLDLKKKNDIINIKKLNLIEKNNLITAEDLKFNKDKLISFKKISVKTSKDNKKNNDFSVSYGKKITIKGSQFDASNLPKILNQKSNKNILSEINKEIQINFKNIIVPLSEKIKNFTLIGQIEKGKFTKISSKGDFGKNNFLDISMKNDSINKKKYLEIYSDLTKPLLTEYSFFKGLTGGKLLYSSIINNDGTSDSKLKIENFKVINAPGMVKLLSLADLGGLADLAEGDGLSFDVLEINLEKGKELLKLNEVLALGPSMSVLMEGYQEKNGLTSLRGTLIPAKTLNKMISKIPLLGNIIIPKEIGEGLFGISFKMKGTPDNIKTSINPIKTLTPRFIQKIIEGNKNPK